MDTFISMLENLLRIIILGVIIWLLWKWASKESRKKKALLAEMQPIERFSVGKYLAGLPNVTHPIPLTCWVTADRFLFVFRDATLVDVIPRTAVTRVVVDKKSQITQRLTATRMLTLGVFALAAPKKSTNETFCLGIDWTGDNGLSMSTVFEFEASQVKANRASGLFQKYVLRRAQPRPRAEIRCPHCAENILADASVCKHCGRDVLTRPKALR